MSTTRMKGGRRRFTPLAAVAVIATALVVVAGAASHGQGAPWQQATAIVTKYEQTIKSLPLKPTAKPIPTGKSVVYIHCGVPACNALADGAAAAAKVLGWKYQTIATKGTPESVKAAWDTAVRLKPDAVIASGWDSSGYESELQQLKAAHTYVGQYAVTDPPGNGITVRIGGPNGVGMEGIQLATWIAADTHGKANTLFVNVPAYAILGPVKGIFMKTYAKYCPGCKVAAMDMPVTALGTTANDQVISYLRAHPDVNYVAYLLDGADIGLPAALKAAGLNGKVKFAGTSPTVENLGYVAAGQEAATVNQSYYEEQADLLDGAARFITGQSTAQDQAFQIPYFIETKGHIVTTSGFGWLMPNALTQLKALWKK